MALIASPSAQLSLDGDVAWLTFTRPAASNAIDRRMIEDSHAAFDRAGEAGVVAVVLRGSPEAFCTGADFAEVCRESVGAAALDAERLYDLWMRMTTAPFITIAVVEGRAVGGGVGFIGASDLVIASATASFALTELLFGLCPACVLPFVARRIGLQRAEHLALTTATVPVDTARAWGLVDEYGSAPYELLDKHLIRLRRLSPNAIAVLKNYACRLRRLEDAWRDEALAVNRQVFADPETRRRIAAFVDEGRIPWRQPRA